MIELKIENGQYRLFYNGRLLLSDTETFPMLYVGCGQETVDMYRGNFKIEDYVTERRALSVTSLEERPDGAKVEYGDDLSLRISLSGDCAVLSFEQKNPAALQEMTAVMMESARKGYWKASSAQLKDIAALHTQLVKKYGASGSQMVTDNQKLQTFMASQVDAATAKAYQQKIKGVREEKISEKEGQVLTKEEMDTAHESTTVVSNLVVAVITVIFVVLIIVLVRRRRNKMNSSWKQ